MAGTFTTFTAGEYATYTTHARWPLIHARVNTIKTADDLLTVMGFMPRTPALDYTTHARWPRIHAGVSTLQSCTDARAILDLLCDVEEVRAAVEYAEKQRWGGAFIAGTLKTLARETDAIHARLLEIEAPCAWASSLAQGTLNELAGVALTESVVPLPFVPIASWVVYRTVRERAWRAVPAVDAWEGFWDVFDDEASYAWDCTPIAPLETGTPCREMNARALFTLPYPKAAVLWAAVENPAPLSLLSVPYVRAVCEWFRRVEAACGPYELVACVEDAAA